MHYQYKVPKISLDNNQKQFVRDYITNGWDSLAAYNSSHKNVNKVRASSLLQSPAIWYEIIEQVKARIKANEDVCVSDKQAVRCYDLCKSATGADPVKIFQVYTKIDAKSNTVKSHDLDVLMVIRKLCYAYHFFEHLERTYFMEHLRCAIKSEWEYYEMVSSANKKAWEGELKELIVELNGIGVNLLQLTKPEQSNK